MIRAFFSVGVPPELADQYVCEFTSGTNLDTDYVPKLHWKQSADISMNAPSDYVFIPCPVRGITTSASRASVPLSRYAASAAGAIAEVGST